jgi:peptidyl-prolyl cis-trans isomerase C
MSMRFKLATVAAAALLAFTAAPQISFAKETGPDSVLATVNGDKILKKDVDAALATLPKQPGTDDAKLTPLIVDQIINEKLLDVETTNAKVQDDAEFKKRLDILSAQLVKQVYLEKFLKGKVTDAAVKAEYEKFKKENSGKEEIHARHILVSTETEAQQVIKDLDGGAKFEDLAKQRSSGPTATNGGDLGYFAKEDMLPEFSDVAFGVKVGEYNKTPVKTQFGWHVINVLDKRKRKVPEFKDLEMAIRNKLGQEALDSLVKDLRSKAKIERFDDAAAAPAKEEKKG